MEVQDTIKAVVATKEATTTKEAFSTKEAIDDGASCEKEYEDTSAGCSKTSFKAQDEKQDAKEDEQEGIEISKA